MRIAFLTLGFLGLCLLARPAPAADTVTLPNCLLSLDEEVEVPAQEAGVLVNIPVREGQSVKRGELLAQIDDAIPQAAYNVALYKLRVAEKQATDDVDVRYAVKAYEYARAQVRRDEAANARNRGTVTAETLDEHRLAQEKFQLSTEKAQKDMEVAALQKDVSTAELQAAEAKLKQHKLFAPLDGVVVELAQHEKEWVQAGDPVLRLLKIDVLRVEGFISSRDYLPAEVENRPVQVVVRLPHDREVTVPGKIVFVKPLIQAGDQFLVRAEVKNPRQGNSWLLSPGMSAKMIIQLK